MKVSMEPETLKMHTDVAEMKGMLTTTLANQAARMEAQESRIQQMDGELGAINGRVSTAESTIIGLGNAISETKVTIDNNRTESKINHDKDITEVKNAQTGQLAKVMIVVGPIIAIASIALVVIKDIYGG